jgi:hypothetical protein
MKNSIDTIGNRTRKLWDCRAVPISTAPPHVSNETNLKTSEIVTAIFCFIIRIHSVYKYEGNSINKLQIQVATYVFELSAGKCHR